MRDKDLQQLTETIKKDWSDTLGYKRFDRHKVFSKEDTSFVLELIGSLTGHHSIKNQLYGLFDGYWYDSLLLDLCDHTTTPFNDILKLKSILSKVDDHLSTVLTK